MKRKTKILLTLLSVLLILGALLAMMLVSAEDIKGITIKSTQSFESLKSDWHYTASGSTNPKVGSVTFLISGRGGAVDVASSLPYEDNKYAVITQDDKVGTTGPYVYGSGGAYPTLELLNNSEYDMSKHSFYSFDIDVMSPSGTFIEAGIDISARYKNASGGNAIWSNTAFSNIVMFGNDSTGSYIYLNGASSTKKYIDPYEFTHITLIVEPKVTSTSYNANTYVYVNGEYFSYRAGTTKTSASAYYNGVMHASILEYRINFSSTSAPEKTLAIDNPTFRIYDKTYNGNLASVIASKTNLDAWESSLYDGSSRPIGKYAAYNETTRVIYDSLSEAIDAASAGDTVRVGCDSDEAIVLSKEIIVSTADGMGGFYSVNITAADGYSLVPIYEGVYKCEKSIETLYEYVSGGVTKTADRSMTVADVISAADSGSTIKLLGNVYCDVDSAIQLKKNLTLDLGGNLIICRQANKVSFMSINGNYSFTLKNGTFVAEYDELGKANVGYPAFGLSTNSKLYINDVDTYTSCIVWSYGGNNTVVNINGGAHYQQARAADVAGGFFESRANTTFTATDATFYCGAGGEGLFSSLHYKTPSGTTKKSTFTYNNCKIYSPSSAQGIIPLSNEFTEVYFNGCDIMGSIHPQLHDWEITQVSVAHGPAKDGSIVIGADCRVAKGASFSSAVRTAEGYSLKENFVTENVTLYNKVGSLSTSDFAIEETSFSIQFDYATETAGSYTVTWYAADGKTVIKTEKVVPGATVTPPTYDSAISNGWFKADYEGWSKNLGGSKITDFKISYDTAFYPAISGSIEADLGAAGYNLSLLGSIAVNLYLPQAPNGITLNGVYGQDGEKVFAQNVIFGGEQYLRYELGEVGAISLTESVAAKVVFTVNGQTFEKEFTLSPYNYAGYILEDSEKDVGVYSESEYTLVADMLRYSNNLIKFVNYTQTGTTTGNTDITKLLNKYSTFCTTLPNNFSDVSAVNIENLRGYVSSLTFEVSGYQPSYKLAFADGSQIVDCYIKMDGYYSSILNGANHGELTYKSDRVTYFSGTEYLSSAYISNVPMYNLDNNIEIFVLLENGTLRSGTYNLNGYYNGVTVYDSIELQQLRNFIKSLRAFSESSVEYRFDTVVITEQEAIDFRSCEHPETEELTLALSEGILPLTATARYCDTCKNHLVYYSDYGVVGDGKTNEFAAVRRAHVAANAIKERFTTYTVTVVSGEGTFYFGEPDDGGAAAIPVVTNVDWDGAHFIIDDTVIDIDGMGYSAAKQSIFILGSFNSRDYSVTDMMPNGIAQGAQNVGYAPGEPTMILLKNNSIKNYIRQGLNQNSGSVQQEIILVDAYGNVDPTTPVEWDYINSPYCTYGCTAVDSNSDGKCDTCSKTVGGSFAATAYSAADELITVSGLDKDGNINCKWETRTNDQVSLETYNQYVRNIAVRRSNTVVEGIDRIFVEDSTNDTPRQTYAGYVNVSFSYNTVVRDMLVNNHLSHYQTNGALLGSYDFSGNTAINTSWINCKIKNFFPANGKVTYRGMFGTNYMRNSYLEGCVLTSFDSHSGAYNVTIENSTFEHINYVGGGEVIMRNVTVYADGGFAACILRQDYGSMWKGDIKMDNITLRHADTYSRDYIDLVRASYTNWYFGFTTHLPGKIYANNVKIEQYTRSNGEYEMGYGTIIEPNLSASTKKLGIYQYLDPQLKNDYDYSTVNENNLDPKVCTEAIYITNTDVEIAYPTHFFFEDMEVYIDGVEQDWFKLRSGLHSHTDSDSDSKCDICGKVR